MKQAHRSKNEVILNEKYKYVHNDATNQMDLHIDGVPCPKKPKALYKFYDTNLNNIASLHENYFWLSKPSDFNDPFDCNVNLVEHENQEELLDADFPRNSFSDIGVTCFTEVIDEPLLWAHYANNYRGFALEFNTETIRVRLDEHTRRFSLNPVLYFDKLISIKNTDEFAMEYLFTAKYQRWQYEKEWRFIADVDEACPYDRIIFYQPIAVKAMYIGHRLFDERESVFNLLESIFMTKYPDKPIYIVHPHSRKLELVFDQRHPRSA